MKSVAFAGPLLFALAVLLNSCCSRPADKGGTAQPLFNGKDLTGWNHVLADSAIPREQVWTVQDGAIICRGEPLGFLETRQSYGNFRLSVEYRWAPGREPGNSGLFSRIQGPPRALPRCVEVQLKHGNAGDLLGLQGLGIATQPRHFHVANHAIAGDIDGVKHVENAEKPAGEWNRVEVLAQGSTYTVWVNGRQVNHVTGVEATPGPIGLQSEGGEIHFRNVTLVPLP